MRYATSKFKRIFPQLLCLTLALVSFALAADEIQFDPEGGFINVTGHATLSSYGLEDHDVSFQDILKLDASSLFTKNPDLANGIQGTVQAGGWIDLKAYVYDSQHQKHVVYHARLEEDSPGAYSTGTRQTVNIKIHRNDTSADHAVPGTEIKRLLQGVDNVYHVTKEDLDRHFRTANALIQHQPGERQRRSLGWALLGTFFGVTAGATLTFIGIAAAAFTGGASITAAIAGVSLASVAIGAVAGGVAGGTAGALAPGDPLGHSDLVSVSVEDSIQKEDYHQMEPERKLYPTGAYPAQVVLEIQNARFIGAKIPGVAELSPALFQVWNTYSPGQLKNLVVSDFWKENPGVLMVGDNEVASPASASSHLEADDYGSSGVVRLTVNPGSSSQESYAFLAGGAAGSSTPALKLGDHITMEVVVPLKAGVSFDSSNHDHYPVLDGFPFSWMAFFAGEALFQCEPSVQPGEWRPWLGYDSQVHGTALRRYPTNFARKFYDWHVDTSRSNYVVFRWTTKLTRRMDADKTSYSAVHNWPKKKTEPVAQRNNQKEGLNMELLRAWGDNVQPTDDRPDFAAYPGGSILPGLDPDEFLYLRENGTVQDIITLDGEPWKQAPDSEASNPLNDIVTAYKKNRLWHVDNKDYRNVYGSDYAAANYEIQDLGTSVAAPNGTGSGNNTAPGRFQVSLPSIASGGRTVNLVIDVAAPLETDKGFYGNIDGPEHPSVWEKGMVYRISGLQHDQAGNYAVSFIYEDSLGRRKYLSFFSSQAPQHIRNRISQNGEWHLAVPSLLGYGYYSVNLWYKNPHFTNSWTRIGGKELLDISLRFLSVPGSRAGGEAAGYSGIDLKESPGDGAHIYLEDFLDDKQGNFAVWKFHRYGKAHTRTYVFDSGDTSTFEVFDADPHTFVHRGTEWYLSSRTQAKRVTNAQLQNDLKFYVDPINSQGRVVEDNTVDGTGNKFVYQWNDVGAYQLKAVYRGVSSVSHRIVVVAPANRQNNIKADVRKRNLASSELGWLRSAGISNVNSSNWKLLSVENLDSRYRYVDGPRVHTNQRQVNRFHPGNDYNDSYRWRIRLNGQFSSYDIDNSNHAPSGLGSAIQRAYTSLHNDWFPRRFVRHTSEKSADNQPMPNDIANGSVSVSQFSSLSTAQTTRIQNLFTNAPEPWQARLPWISFVTDFFPYRDDNTTIISYRARTNIKVIYNMEAFFNNETGAFSGNPTDLTGGDDSYDNMVRRGIYLHLMSDTTKLSREFYLDLLTGRKIITSSNVDSAEVMNARSSSSPVIARL